MFDLQNRWRLNDDSFAALANDHDDRSTMPIVNQEKERGRNGFDAQDRVDAAATRSTPAIDKDAVSLKPVGLEKGGPSIRNGTSGSKKNDHKLQKLSEPRISFWRELFNRTEKQRNLPALLAQGGEQAAGTAQFALLASRLQRWSAEQGKRVVLVTSAIAGEGKSFVSVNLAAVLADLGSSVVLVDADLRTPCLDRCMGIKPLKGLAAYLAGEADLSECLYTTSVPRLTLLAAGEVTAASTRALADARTRDGIEALRNLAPPHFVLVDSPSILSAAEVQILAGLTDAVMMVIAANRTPRAAVQNALHTIKGAPLLGIVFNRFEPSRSASRAARATPVASYSPDMTNHDRTRR